MVYVISVLTVVSLAACGYDRFDAPSDGCLATCNTVPNADLSVLYDTYVGEPAVVEEELVFEGYVTSDDTAGNFFRSFIIDDGTAAVEIRAGFYDLQTRYQRGRRVVLRAAGTAVGVYNGIIQIGACVADYSSYRVEEFGSRILLEEYLKRDAVVREPEPLRLRIGELAAEHCGRLVRIDSLVHVAQDGLTTWALGGDDAVPATGNAVFRTISGERIVVTTSGYADFAAERIPAGMVSVTGILMYGAFGGSQDVFALKMRDINDVDY